MSYSSANRAASRLESLRTIEKRRAAELNAHLSLRRIYPAVENDDSQGTDVAGMFMMRRTKRLIVGNRFSWVVQNVEKSVPFETLTEEIKCPISSSTFITDSLVDPIGSLELIPHKSNKASIPLFFAFDEGPRAAEPAVAFPDRGMAIG